MCKAEQGLDVALLVGPADPAEVMHKQVVALQPEKLVGQFPGAGTQNLFDRDLAVVVADALGHATEKLERSAVAILERFHAFLWEHAAEDGVAVRQRQHEERYRDLLALQDDLRSSKIDLGLARRMAQRHEDLGALPPPITDHLLHRGVPAGIAMFVSQTLQNANGGVVLLTMHVPVLPENLRNDRQEGPDLPLRPRLTLSVPGRCAVLQYLLQRVPMNVELPAHTAPTAPLYKHQSPNLCPLLHVRKHP